MLGVVLTLTGAVHQHADDAGSEASAAPALAAAPDPTPRPVPQVPESPDSARTAARQGNVPRWLDIPALGVSAPVVPISTSPGGVLTPPDDPQTLGWWAQGARPGDQRGGALITGHTVHTGGGAFDDLEQLPRGADVGVATKRGVVSYAVTQVTVYPKSTLAADAETIFSQSVAGRLVLVTCEDWNGREYASNVVVVAEPLS